MLRDNVFNLFNELQVSIEPRKAQLENMPIVAKYITSLDSPSSWLSLDRIIMRAKNEERPILCCNYWLPFESQRELISELFKKDSLVFLNIVSSFFDQFAPFESDRPSEEANSYLLSLVDCGALLVGKEVLEYCSNCQDVRIVAFDKSREKCASCANQLWLISRCTLDPNIRECIFNGLHLELYVKKCLRSANFDVITKRSSQGDVATSITYDIGGERVETDLIALAGTSLLFFEVTTATLVPNYVNKKVGALGGFVDFLKERLGSPVPSFKYAFVCANEIDRNLSTTKENRFFFDREDVPRLRERLADLRTRL